jgi:hypothetical protein
MKKNIDTKKLLFENMGKLNPDFKLNEEDKWIQKAVDPEHKGYCTPMTKPTCTPKRKALAKRFKKGIEDESVDFNYIMSGGDVTKKKAEEIKAKIDAWYEEGEDDAISAIHSFLMKKGKPFPLSSPEEIKEIFDKLYKNGR